MALVLVQRKKKLGGIPAVVGWHGRIATIAAEDPRFFSLYIDFPTPSLFFLAKPPFVRVTDLGAKSKIVDKDDISFVDFPLPFFAKKIALDNVVFAVHFVKPAHAVFIIVLHQLHGRSDSRREGEGLGKEGGGWVRKMKAKMFLGTSGRLRHFFQLHVAKRNMMSTDHFPRLHPLPWRRSLECPVFLSPSIRCSRPLRQPATQLAQRLPGPGATEGFRKTTGRSGLGKRRRKSLLGSGSLAHTTAQVDEFEIAGHRHFFHNFADHGGLEFTIDLCVKGVHDNREEKREQAQGD